ncbi:hypothetical protein BDW42DRAFT_164475 [Aspergillus taichungensis]|uniref:ARM repeat-containing protein n=1 Tax=Aspergillus taichungensis TaxID=482145 RepID=A0A2J5I1I0_9EURO|nr:hypothetical protein BDW42DRAFT_164475 [Aspergillus taichungensis]
MDPSALHHLTTTPWATLQHAYGPATDIPTQLLSLQSPDRQARSDAYDQLYSNIYHQSDRYEATAYAVPYILSILSNPAAPDRPRLFCLLLDLALGIPAEALPLGVKARSTSARGVSTWRDVPDGQVDYGLVAYDAVRAGVPLFWRCLEHTEDDGRVRAWAACALAYFPSEVNSNINADTNRLLHLMDQETDIMALASIMITLGLLLSSQNDTLSLQDNPSRTSTISRLHTHSTNPHPLLRWAAAVALIRLGHHSSENVDVITRALTDPSFIPAEFHVVFPFCEGDFGKYSAKILKGLDLSVYPGVVPAVLEALPRLPRPDALNLAEVTMELAFGAMPGDEDEDGDEEEEKDDDDDDRHPEQMSEIQRQTVMALAEWDDDEVWAMGILGGILEEWNIPGGSRDECRRYIGLSTLSVRTTFTKSTTVRNTELDWVMKCQGLSSDQRMHPQN